MRRVITSYRFPCLCMRSQGGRFPMGSPMVTCHALGIRESDLFLKQLAELPNAQVERHPPWNKMLVRKYRFRMRFVNPEANIFNRFFTIFRVLTFLTRISHKRNPSAFTFIFTQVPVVYFEVLSVIRNVTENISAKMTCSICVCCDDYLMYGNFSGPNSGLPLLILRKLQITARAGELFLTKYAN